MKMENMEIKNKKRREKKFKETEILEFKGSPKTGGYWKLGK